MATYQVKKEQAENPGQSDQLLMSELDVLKNDMEQALKEDPNGAARILAENLFNSLQHLSSNFAPLNQ